MKNLSEPVLVLNANFAPINICTTKRALALMLTGKASLVLNGRGVIQSVTQVYPRPSIIRLGMMIKRPHPHVKLSKREIFRRDGYICQYCGQHKKNLTIDHVIPRRLGGSHSWNNLVTACAPCNHYKGGRTVEQANLRLLHAPVEPSSSAQYIFGRYVGHNQEWEPFLEGW